MAKNKIFQNATHVAIVLAIGLLALSFIGTQTGFVPHSPTSVCNDDDGGDIFTLGICSDQDEVSGDFCVSDTEVLEHNCVFNQCVSSTASCPLGDVCLNGRCINPNALA